MAGVDVEVGGEKRRSVAAEINMVPMIDLLLCCIMFLLVTAVWTQLADLRVSQDADGGGDTPAGHRPQMQLVLLVQSGGFVLADTAGARQEIPNRSGAYDLAELRNRLRDRHRVEPNRSSLIVSGDDGVAYDDVIQAMDVTRSEGFEDLTVGSPQAI